MINNLREEEKSDIVYLEYRIPVPVFWCLCGLLVEVHLRSEKPVLLRSLCNEFKIYFKCNFKIKYIL